MVFIIWMIIFGQFQAINSGYIERVTVSGCHTCQLFLTCRHLNSIIAIFNVNFEPKSGENDIEYGGNESTETSLLLKEPREALNKRCSGVNHCSFILIEDCPGTELWGPGNVTINYACITEDRISKYCNTEIVLPNEFSTGISEGFIRNPGYPRFYAGHKFCRFKITAPSRQKIQIKVLDLSLIVKNDICIDELQIKENGNVLHSTCQLENPPLTFLSYSETLELVISSNYHLNPQRGVLVHYQAVGCPTFDAPEDGYLVFRNDTVAEYSCCVGFVFPDTGSRVKVLNCFGARWDTPIELLYCRKTLFPIITIESKYNSKHKEMAAELIAPAIIILALFIINGLVLFFIYRVKQKHSGEITNEELATFSTNSP